MYLKAVFYTTTVNLKGDFNLTLVNLTKMCLSLISPPPPSTEIFGVTWLGYEGKLHGCQEKGIKPFLEHNISKLSEDSSKRWQGRLVVKIWHINMDEKCDVTLPW